MPITSSGGVLLTPMAKPVNDSSRALALNDRRESTGDDDARRDVDDELAAVDNADAVVDAIALVALAAFILATDGNTD